LLLAFGMFLTTWPRWDVNLLVGVIPPYLVLLSIWAKQHLNDRARPAAYTTGLVLQLGVTTSCFFFLASIFFTLGDYTYFPPRVGELRNSEADGAAMEILENTI